MDDLCLHINLIVNYKIASGADDFRRSFVVGAISEARVEKYHYLPVSPSLGNNEQTKLFNFVFIFLKKIRPIQDF